MFKKKNLYTVTVQQHYYIQDIIDIRNITQFLSVLVLPEQKRSAANAAWIPVFWG